MKRTHQRFPPKKKSKPSKNHEISIEKNPIPTSLDHGLCHRLRCLQRLRILRILRQRHEDQTAVLRLTEGGAAGDDGRVKAGAEEVPQITWLRENCAEMLEMGK